MKRLLSGICGLAVLVILAVPGLAHGNSRGTSKLDINGKTVSVEYGQPSLKGRSVDEMLGKLKLGDVWRLGADASTTFATPIDLMFGKVALPPASTAFGRGAKPATLGNWSSTSSTASGEPSTMQPRIWSRCHSRKAY